MKLNAILKTRQRFDFERFGFDVARETRELAKAIEIGGLKIHEYRATLQPDLDSLRSAVSVASNKKTALCAQVYDSNDPVSDKAMLARKIALKILVCVLSGVLFTSIAAHTYRLILFGLAEIVAVILGIVLTLFVLGLGYLAFDRLLRDNGWAQAAAIAIATGVMILGMFQLAHAGGIAVSKTDADSKTVDSYVDGSGSQPPQTEMAQQTDQQHLENLLSSAITNILLSADLMLGILLGTVLQLRTDEKYAAWKEIEKLEQEIAQMNWKIKVLLGNLEVAQRQCMAGILRFFYTQRKQHLPYFQAAAVCAAIVMFASATATAQSVTREEGILIDVSGSIGAGGASSELFREYLTGARQLLLTEPPSSRVVVSVISTESFGSTQELLKGWTPAARGVFTDDLNRARHQLASAFETKASSMTPIAAGTDIIGGLWHMKAMLESTSSSSPVAEREVWIFSDMMNETAALQMPALLANGPEKMLDQAKANSLMVPLKGYRIHIVGASIRGLSPQGWNAVKEFWSAYFRAVGAEMLSYSAESSAQSRGQ